jgi:hypothetical protein
MNLENSEVEEETEFSEQQSAQSAESPAEWDGWGEVMEQGAADRPPADGDLHLADDSAPSRSSEIQAARQRVQAALEQPSAAEDPNEAAQQETVAEARRQVAEALDGPGERLTAKDRAALHEITGTQGDYLRINGNLRFGHLDDVKSIALDSHNVTEALEKLDDYKGPVYRRLDTDLMPEQIARYEPGQIVVENGYTHGTMDEGFEYGQGNVKWIIDSDHGKIVDGLSDLPSEHEVIFNRFSKFRVLARSYLEDERYWQIIMREV